MSPIVIRNRSFDPPVFPAPMAGISHSAFRRLLSEWGGFGAQYSEMLALGAAAKENPRISPFTKRRPGDGAIIYQLLIHGVEGIAPALERLSEMGPEAFDINLSCPAPEVVKRGGGAALFRNEVLCASVLREVRRVWHGPLLVKCRLGDNTPDWSKALQRRLSMFREEGVDALTMHPRFFDEKLKRCARWNVLPAIAREAGFPVIGNGDIVSSEDARAKARTTPGIGALMVGRMLVVQPWLLGEIQNGTMPIDYLSVWKRFVTYVLEDFPPEKAIGRIKQFAAYYARNFFYGHELFRKVQSSRTLDELSHRAEEFLSANPQTVRQPTVSGI